MACQFPESLILARFSPGQLFSFFIPAVQCVVTWTALLNPINRTPISSTFFLTTLLSPFFYPKPLLYLSHSPLSLILMLLLISGDIHPNTGPIDPCSVCSGKVTWGSKSVQCTNCSLWVHLSCSDLSPADFRKIFPGHSWTFPMQPSSSQLFPSLFYPKPVSSSIKTPNPPSSFLIHKHPQNNTFKNEPSPQNNHK